MVELRGPRCTSWLGRLHRHEGFRAEDAASYYDYSLLGTEPVEQFGSEPTDYSTDVVAKRAVDFITGADPATPLFAVFAPYGPHAPFHSAPRHAGLWPKERLQAPANEADISDKPAFMQALLPLPTPKLRRITRKQHETLLSVDEAVRQIYDALGPDRAANTLFVLLSDNGLMNGDHRLLGKYVPYAGATEIPLLMRWDGVIEAGQVNSRVFTIQDVTTTIVEAAGASLPTEGVGYLSPPRDGTVLEGIETTKDGFTRPAYCGWRTERYLYVRYSNGAGEELYDYDVDPAELDNRVTDPAYAETLEQLRATAQPACTPGPPGFLWDAEPRPRRLPATRGRLHGVSRRVRGRAAAPGHRPSTWPRAGPPHAEQRPQPALRRRPVGRTCHRGARRLHRGAA